MPSFLHKLQGGRIRCTTSQSRHVGTLAGTFGTGGGDLAGKGQGCVCVCGSGTMESHRFSGVNACGRAELN